MKTEFIVLVVSFLVACGVSNEDSGVDCYRGDLTQWLASGAQEAEGRELSSEELQTLVDYTDSEWLEDAVHCKVGDLVFVAPANSAESGFMVLDGDLRVIRGDEYVDFQDNEHLHVTLRDETNDGHFDSVGYDTWSLPNGRHLHTIDWNTNGQFDYRTTETEDGSVLEEGWVEGRWQEIGLEGGMHLLSDPSIKVRRVGGGDLEIVRD